jgi:hypothetical protein
MKPIPQHFENKTDYMKRFVNYVILFKTPLKKHNSITHLIIVVTFLVVTTSYVVGGC